MVSGAVNREKKSAFGERRCENKLTDATPRCRERSLHKPSGRPAGRGAGEAKSYFAVAPLWRLLAMFNTYVREIVWRLSFSRISIRRPRASKASWGMGFSAGVNRCLEASSADLILFS